MNTFAHVFLGTAFTSLSPKQVRILKDHLFCINKDGIIARVIAPDEAGYEELLAASPGPPPDPGAIPAARIH